MLEREIRVTAAFVIVTGLVGCGGVPDESGGRVADGVGKSAAALTSSLSLDPIFGADMVLQRGVPVPVFGSTDAGATVVVEFQAQSVSAVADASGRWLATLAALSASSTPSSLSVSSDGLNVTLDGVQVGEVWLCSGQSNMGRPLSSADGSAPYIADAPNHNLRLFRMTANNGPATASWQISNASTAASFSAVGYWMGLDLAESLDVPVGLIQATLDGSDISEWQHTNGGTGDAYDAMVSPILPFALRGVAWYQGESNGGEAAYQTKLTAMIGEWRSDFGTTPLPFGIVQLPATKWSAAKLGQYNVSRTVADTFLVVTADLPGGNQLHPTTKYPVGIRTGVGARGAVYGEAIEYSGPVPAASSFVSGNTVTVNYDHVGNGLTTSNGQAPSTFQVAGSNNQYVSATATLIGNSIEVRSNRVSAPKHVRYGFTGAGNVRNAVNVPTEGGAQTLTSLPGSLYQLDFP